MEDLLRLLLGRSFRRMRVFNFFIFKMIFNLWIGIFHFFEQRVFDFVRRLSGRALRRVYFENAIDDDVLLEFAEIRYVF